jgi:hypothetical protein
VRRAWWRGHRWEKSSVERAPPGKIENRLPPLKEIEDRLPPPSGEIVDKASGRGENEN